MNEFEQLHPALQYHVVNTLGWNMLRPTQLAAIAPIQAGAHCLLLAPTAGGKTEAAVIPMLSRMLKDAWPATSVLYICPIKALLNNLEHRLSHYAGLVGRRVEVWHGDVSQSRKKRALKDAKDILLTTPESIEGMLISTRVDRQTWFGNLQAVIVDELHAFASDDRGWHLRSVLHRLDQYLARPLQRIGLSATVRNPEELLTWFAPTGERSVVGTASVSTDAEVTIDHVSSLENAVTVIARLYGGQKRLVFCDSRSSAEQVGNKLRAHDIRTFVSHASLSASERHLAESAFAEEKDCVIVATSTLELGIDVGDLDRVIQIDAPSTVSSFLQRMGRTGRRSEGRRNCLFLTTNENAFLLALGIAQRWSEHWVEATRPPAQPWPIVAQQALAATLERGELPITELIQLLDGSFPELDALDIGSVVQHLVNLAFLDCAEGLVSVGASTEREYGRGHYRELLASFTGSALLTGRHGNTEIGYIDPSVLSGEQDNLVILLAGRSWRVTQVEWARKAVWLEPADAGGKARWVGEARGLSGEVCQGIRTALSGGAPMTVSLSQRAKTALESLTTDLGISPGTHLIGSLTSHGAARTWTFAGTRMNRTYSWYASRGKERVRYDALSILANVGVLDSAICDMAETPVTLAPDELAAFAKSIKFASCVPSSLLSRTVIARNFATPTSANVPSTFSDEQELGVGEDIAG